MQLQDEEWNSKMYQNNDRTCELPVQKRNNLWSWPLVPSDQNGKLTWGFTSGNVRLSIIPQAHKKL